MKLTEERGAALVLTLLIMAGLSLLSFALVMIVQTETRTSAAYKYGQQAFYVANGGIQKAVVWFNTQYNPHLPASDYDATQSPVQYSGHNVLLAGQTGSTSSYPASSVITTFTDNLSNQSLQANSNNSGVYAVNATLLKYTPVSVIDLNTLLSSPSAVERWRIDSDGSWGSTASPLGTSQITAVIENTGDPIFDRGLWGINSVNLSGTVRIDSYDPNLGLYGGANVGDLGSIGTNGSVMLNGSVQVRGDVAYGPSGTYTTLGGPTVTGQVIQVPRTHVFPPLPSFTVGTQDVTLGGHNSQTLSPGSYRDISLTAQSSLVFSGGVYYLNSLSTAGQASITVSSDTTLFIKSGLDLSGGSVVNTTTDPSKLSIYFSGTSSVTLTGGSGFYGSVYCPNAPLTLSGNTGFYGSYIGQTVNDSGTPQVHFDEGLLNRVVQRPFRIITWSQNTF